MIKEITTFLGESFLVGWGVLFGAILINIIANGIGLISWYDLFLNEETKSFLDYIWLLIIYPFLLGVIVVFINKYKKRLS